MPWSLSSLPRTECRLYKSTTIQPNPRLYPGAYISDVRRKALTYSQAEGDVMKIDIKNWQRMITVTTLSGLMLFVSAAAAAAGTTVYEQPPNHSGGFDSQFSDAVPASQRIVVADEFQFDQSTTIDTITWWGSPRTFEADTFTIR